MSPPQISVDIALTLIRNSDTNFLIGYQNSIPDPRYLTIEQRCDHTAAVVGKPEPHKFIYFHFKKVEGLVRSKRIIMHRYPNACHHDWDNQDDINKLNVFRVAAITLGFTDSDISVGERCWSIVPKSLKRMWFPNLVQFVEEDDEYDEDDDEDDGDDGDDEDDGDDRDDRDDRDNRDDEDNEDDEDDGDDGDDADNGISPGRSDEFGIVADIPEGQNDSVTIVHSITQAGAESSEEQQGSAEAEDGTTLEATDDHSVAVYSSDDEDGVRNRQAIEAYYDAQVAFILSSDTPGGSSILNPYFMYASRRRPPAINYHVQPYIHSPIVNPHPLRLPAGMQSLNLNNDPDAMDFDLDNSVNNEGDGDSSLL